MILFLSACVCKNECGMMDPASKVKEVILLSACELELTGSFSHHSYVICGRMNTPPERVPCGFHFVPIKNCSQQQNSEKTTRSFPTEESTVFAEIVTVSPGFTMYSVLFSVEDLERSNV